MSEQSSRAERSAIMRRVKSAHTGPEQMLRAMFRQCSIRFRSQAVSLPGKPDFRLLNGRAVIFLHGCFWHQHSCKRGNRQPVTRRAYWLPKLERNVARDRANRRELKKLGWRVLTIWECELASPKKIEKRLNRFLSAS